MTKPEKKALVPALRFPEFQNAGMWDEHTFGGVATFFNGRAYKQEELLDTGKYRVLRVGNFFSNNEWYYSDLELEDNKYCENGDLLYAWSASFGPRIWKEEKVIYHYHIWKVVENEGINKTFLFILLGYETERMKSRSANGLGLMHITKGAIESWKCYLPTFDEQQKIADCLSSIDDLITAQTQKLAALKAHKKGLMQQLFPAEGETVPELRFPEFRDGGEWESFTLFELVEVASGQVNPTEYPYCNMPHIGGENIESHTGSIKGVRAAKELGLISGKYLFDERDVLYSKIRPVLNKVGIPDFQGICSADIYPIRPANQKLCRQYLAYLLLSESFLEYATKHSDRSKIPKLNRDSLLAYELVIPSRPEQQKIADCLSSVDEMITAQAEKIDALKHHKKGLMQQLFPSMDEVEA